MWELDFFQARQLDSLDIVQLRLHSLGIAHRWTDDQTVLLTADQFSVFCCDWIQGEQWQWRVVNQHTL